MVYRSERRSGTYLYLPLEPGDNAMQALPQALRESLGSLTEVMRLELHAGRKLAAANIDIVLHELAETGFYLQLPPGERLRTPLDD